MYEASAFPNSCAVLKLGLWLLFLTSHHWSPRSDSRKHRTGSLRWPLCGWKPQMVTEPGLAWRDLPPSHRNIEGMRGHFEKFLNPGYLSPGIFVYSLLKSTSQTMTFLIRKQREGLFHNPLESGGFSSPQDRISLSRQALDSWKGFCLLVCFVLFDRKGEWGQLGSNRG